VVLGVVYSIIAAIVTGLEVGVDGDGGDGRRGGVGAGELVDQRCGGRRPLEGGKDREQRGRGARGRGFAIDA
jgi:hypothetical protein